MSSPKRIIIIGAGPGGYVAAIRAAQLGVQVTIVEEHEQRQFLKENPPEEKIRWTRCVV